MPRLFDELAEVIAHIRALRKRTVLNHLYGGQDEFDDVPLNIPWTPSTSRTGRIQYNEFPSLMDGRPKGVLTVENMPADFDYAELELRVADALRAHVDSLKLHDWLGNREIILPVKVRLNGSGGVFVKYGRFEQYVGGSSAFDTLTNMGFRVEVAHKRYYSVPESSDPVLMTAGEARYAVPIAGSLVYRVHGQPDVKVVSGDIDSLLPNGGVTTARIYHPAGFWGEGVARCRPDEWIKGQWVTGDNFDKDYGRNMAISRACDAMAEVTPDA